jgi:hypothetical protein
MVGFTNDLVRDFTNGSFFLMIQEGVFSFLVTQKRGDFENSCLDH